ncbi:MAG: glycosyltransferase [Pirellulaceae bacterium]|nr:glycosyltransferase [Pirellulaceae bacterium]
MPPIVHIVHVVRDLELASGGPSRSIPQLVLALDQLRTCHEHRWIQHVAFCDRGQPNAQFPDRGEALRLEPVSGGRSSLGALAGRMTQLHSQSPLSLIHVHGLWSPPVHRVITWARRNRVPYVVSPRGMLSEWCFNHKRLKKRIGWWLYQHSDLQNAAAIHATSNDEMLDARRMKLKPTIAVIPNGSDLPNYERPLIVNKPVRMALCLTRLHPVKGIDMLIEIWAKLKPANWRLHIAGPSEAGMREKLRQLIQKHNLHDSVTLGEEADETEKQSLLKDADLFILPSKSENFGMVIAEALAIGLPVVTTTGTPWAEVKTRGCGWIAAPEPDDLALVIQQALAQPPEVLHNMGQLGRQLIDERFAWSSVANQMKTLYQSLFQSSASNL